MQAKQTGAMLLIDGAFLTQPSAKLQKRTNRRLKLDETGLRILFDFIEQKSKVKFHPNLKHFVSAEEDELDVVKRWNYYENLEKRHGIRVDLRNFKSKNAYCPQKGCPFNESGFQIKVQREVDVAIVMKVVNACFLNQMDELVLVAGDGDFKDMLDFVINTLHKKLIVFGWNDCTSTTLIGRARDCFFPLDEIWEHISEPIGPKEICPFFLQGNCKYGDSCNKLHQQVQQNPEVKKLCNYFASGNCKYGEKCLNMHLDPQDKQICVYDMQGVCKKGDACPYSHGSQQKIQTVSQPEKQADPLAQSQQQAQLSKSKLVLSQMGFDPDVIAETLKHQLTDTKEVVNLALAIKLQKSGNY